jgi:tRNA(Ile)-lysidine synthase
VSIARLRQAPPALARLVLRRALAQSGGLRGVSFRHVDTLLRLVRRAAASGRSLALPGGRVAQIDFDRLRIAPRQPPPAPFAAVLDVPGRVDLPGGRSLVAAAVAAPAPATPRCAVVAAPDGPLSVRTRRPGDRVRAHGREISLKRFLIERKVPSGIRPGLPLVAAGSRILWVPGQLLEDDRGGARLIRLELLGRLKEAS